MLRFLLQRRGRWCGWFLELAIIIAFVIDLLNIYDARLLYTKETAFLLRVYSYTITVNSTHWTISPLASRFLQNDGHFGAYGISQADS